MILLLLHTNLNRSSSAAGPETLGLDPVKVWTFSLVIPLDFVFNFSRHKHHNQSYSTIHTSMKVRISMAVASMASIRDSCAASPPKLVPRVWTMQNRFVFCCWQIHFGCTSNPKPLKASAAISVGSGSSISRSIEVDTFRNGSSWVVSRVEDTESGSLAFLRDSLVIPCFCYAEVNTAIMKPSTSLDTLMKSRTSYAVFLFAFSSVSKKPPPNC
jgi:hypothetical protein